MARPSKAALRSFGTNLPGLSAQSLPVKGPLAKTTVVRAPVGEQVQREVQAAKTAYRLGASGGTVPTKTGLTGGSGPKASQHKSGGLFGHIPGVSTALKVGRAVGVNALAEVEEGVRHPLNSVLKNTGSAIKMGTGIPVGLAALVDRAAAPELSAGKAAITGHNPIKAYEGSVKKTAAVGKRFASEEATHVSKTYGPAYRGDKGALKQARADIHKHGGLSRIVDAATVGLPLDMLATKNLGKIAEARALRGEKPGLIGKVSGATQTRPGIKINPLKEAAPQRLRRTLSGTAINKTVDAARAGAQKVAETRAKNPDAILGKKLSARRSHLGDNEVAPISNTLADTKLKFGTAKTVTRGHLRAGVQQARDLVGKGIDTMRGSVRDLTPEERQAALVAHRDGIVNSKGAKAFLDKHIAEIHANLAPGQTSKNLALYEKWRDDPSIFDRPHVREAAETIRRTTKSSVGGFHGLNPERAVHGRTDLQAGTLGVPSPAEINAARKASQVAEEKAARGNLQGAQSRVTKARLTEARVKGRVAGIAGKNLDTATLKSIARHEDKLARQPAAARAAAETTPAAATRAVASGHERELEASQRELSAAHAAHGSARARSAAADRELQAAQRRATAAKRQATRETLSKSAGRNDARAAASHEAAAAKAADLRARADRAHAHAADAAEKAANPRVKQKPAPHKVVDAMAGYELREYPSGSFAVVDTETGEKMAGLHSQGAKGGKMRNRVRAEERLTDWAHYEALPGGRYAERTAAHKAAASAPVASEAAAAEPKYVANARGRAAAAEHRAQAAEAAAEEARVAAETPARDLSRDSAAVKKAAQRRKGRPLRREAGAAQSTKAAHEAAEADLREKTIAAHDALMDARRARSAARTAEIKHATLTERARQESKVAVKERKRLASVAPKAVSASRESLEAQAARDSAKVRLRQARQPHERFNETPDEYRARVVQAAHDAGLVGGEYARTAYEEKDISHAGAARGGGRIPNSVSRQQTREGINYRTGNESLDIEDHIKGLMKTIERGNAARARSDVLERDGKFYPSEEAAIADLDRQGIDYSKDKGEVSIVPAGKVLKKTGATPATSGPGSDAGDFVHSSDVVVIPRATADELDALATPQGAVMKRLSKIQRGSQASILGANPSWWGFQRLADVIGVGSAGITPQRWLQLRSMHTELDPVTREELNVVTGHGISSATLTPDEPGRLGIAAKLYAKNPLLRKAFEGHNPFMRMIQSDANIVGKNREYITMKKALDSAQGKRLNGDVLAVHESLKPLVDAAAKGDAKAFNALVNDPAFQEHLERGAEATARIMGDFSSMTALEKNAKTFVTFYGFLRFSTRLLFYTLPYESPLAGAMVYQLGQMGQRDAQKIIGPDLPYGFGAFYQKGKDGSYSAFDLSRAFPTGSSILSIHSPGQVASLLSPVAGIAANQIAGRNLFTGQAYEKSLPGGLQEKATLKGRAGHALQDLTSLVAPIRVATQHKPIGQLSPVPLQLPTKTPLAGKIATQKSQDVDFATEKAALQKRDPAYQIQQEVKAAKKQQGAVLADAQRQALLIQREVQLEKLRALAGG